MKKLFGVLALCLAFALPSHAANVRITDLPAAASVTGTNLFECSQSLTSRKCTAAQIAAYNYSLMSGDATAASGGAVTFATVNGNVGSFGSATQCTSVTVNAKGLVTAASQSTCAPAVGSVSGLGTGVATALGVNVGSAGAPVTFNGALGTPSSGTLTNATGLPVGGISGLGSGVRTALGAALSAAGGVTTTIASGTSALGTSSISSATCATVVTTSAPNTATTDVVSASFNSDPTGVVGYQPLTTGMLSIIAYPTSGNVNFKVCNNTAGNITPQAITLNWRVTR